MKILYEHPNGSKIVEYTQYFPEFVTTIDGMERRIPINMVNPISWDTLCIAYKNVLMNVSSHAKMIELNKIKDMIKRCEDKYKLREPIQKRKLS